MQLTVVAGGAGGNYGGWHRSGVVPLTFLERGSARGAVGRAFPAKLRARACVGWGGGMGWEGGVRRAEMKAHDKHGMTEVMANKLGTTPRSPP
jgi:hypothetical protein